MPTKISPRSFSAGPMAAQMSLLAGRQLGRLGLAAGMHVGARLARRRHAVDRAHRLAIDQDDALVALAHLRQIALDDHRLAVELGEHLDQRVQVLVARRDVEHAGPAIAEQGLDDDVLVLVAEGADLAAGPRRSGSAASARRNG